MIRGMTSLTRGLAGALLAGAVVLAQQQPSPSRLDSEFDAASIKPNHSGSGRTTMSMPAIGTFRAENVPLRELIVEAYRVRRFQVESGIDWLDGDRFDVTARTAEGAAQNQMHVMLQTLLADRFGLAMHRETRERPVYALVVARDDGGPSAALQKSSCTEQCGLNGNTTNGVVTLVAKGQPLRRLADWLGDRADRLVIDRSGLSGSYDFELHFTRDEALERKDLPAGSPALPTALREQLGLKFESARGPVEFLVIDHASRPTPD
jgi:uncharacterized protein (TIGR03435 family)